MCMSFVAVGRSLMIVSYVAFKMAALWFWTMFNYNPPIAHCHPLLWGWGILVDHWSTISSIESGPWRCVYATVEWVIICLGGGLHLFVAKPLVEVVLAYWVLGTYFNDVLIWVKILKQHACINVIIPPEQRSCWGVYWFHSVRLSVRLSVRPSVRLSRLPCPLCNIYSSGWILSILATNDHYHERVCRTQWPLTLTYIFKVIRPWLRKSCPLCSVYSSGWILFIFGTNDHYH